MKIIRCYALKNKNISFYFPHFTDVADIDSVIKEFGGELVLSSINIKVKKILRDRIDRRLQRDPNFEGVIFTEEEAKNFKLIQVSILKNLAKQLKRDQFDLAKETLAKYEKLFYEGQPN